MNLFKTERKPADNDKIPTSVDMAIPISETYEDGIFLVGRGKYSKMFKFTDINYTTSSKDDKGVMFLGYSEILNTLDSDAETKITINRHIHSAQSKCRYDKFEERDFGKSGHTYNTT